jgi:uncharacterized protein (TIGR02145 family)
MKTIKTLKFSLLFILMIFFTVSCVEDDDAVVVNENPLNLVKGITETGSFGTVSYQPNVISLNQELKSLIVEVNEGNIKINYNPSLDAVEVGDILISGPIPQSESGFSRKVIAVEKSGGQIITFITNLAPWLDTFVLVDYTQTFAPVDMRLFQPVTNTSIELTTGTIGFKFDFNATENTADLGVTFDLNNNFDTTFDQIGINGSLFIETPAPPVVILFSDGNIENTVFAVNGFTKIEPSLTLSYGSEIGIDLQDAIDGEDQMLNELLNKKINIGRVPIVGVSGDSNLSVGIQLVFFAELKISIAGKLSLVFSKELAYQYDVSFIGDREEKWQFNFNQANEEPLDIEFLISGKIALEASPLDIGLQVSIPQFTTSEEQFVGVFASPFKIEGVGEIIYNETTDCFDINTSLEYKTEFYFKSQLNGVLPEWLNSFDIQTTLYEINYGENDDDAFPVLCIEDGPEIEFPEEVNFPETGIGLTETIDIIITNTGDSSLIITSIEFPFNVYNSSWSSGFIEPLESQNISITFTPSEPIVYNGIVTIESNAVNSVNDINQFQITGSGTNATNVGSVQNPIPNDNSTNISLNGNLSFTEGNNTPTDATFKVYFDTSSNPNTVFNLDANVNTLNYSNLQEATPYYWKVETISNTGNVLAISPIWSFTTATNSGGTAVVDVLNPITGKTWMDRNLGASQAATSITDAAAYGDLYQWGRAADGHEKRNSGITSTLSSTDNPGHGDFITTSSSPRDWRSPQNNNLWQGVNGTNNPCPSGYRLPTDTELLAERDSWSSNNSAGAFASPLKFPVAGHRLNSFGSLEESSGFYWSSSTVSGTRARGLFFINSAAGLNMGNRAYGLSVRCLKD